jgi:hypothetical protein
MADLKWPWPTTRPGRQRGGKAHLILPGTHHASGTTRRRPCLQPFESSVIRRRRIPNWNCCSACRKGRAQPPRKHRVRKVLVCGRTGRCLTSLNQSLRCAYRRCPQVIGHASGPRSLCRVDSQSPEPEAIKDSCPVCTFTLSASKGVVRFTRPVGSNLTLSATVLHPCAVCPSAPSSGMCNQVSSARPIGTCSFTQSLEGPVAEQCDRKPLPRPCTVQAV